ncbi:MAG TPA: hypothetical protein VEZ40_16675 [Pyrinomonadaceae bacterium]|nr:hypothetical protein [Pyrinomonadaceae bacterium]
MKKLMLAATLTMFAAVSAQAQVSRRPGEGDNTRQAALRDPDPVRRDERLISISRREMMKSENAVDAARPAPSRMFKARVAVTNHGSKTIKSVSWLASLTDPATGAVIRTYPVTTEKQIAPGKSKTLEKSLPIPYASVVSVGRGRRVTPGVADLKASVVRVTYDDGSTSETP